MRCRTMADGTLRMEVDIEPGFAKAAFSLFGAPGSPIAVARLMPQGFTPDPEPDEKDDKPKGGSLAKLAGQWCGSLTFQNWLRSALPSLYRTVAGELDESHHDHTDVAAEVVRRHCGVKSRAELDSNADAARKFHNDIRIPYSEHIRGSQ